jgi:uncharacterized glyoxalase superfamily protein PhnB
MSWDKTAVLEMAVPILPVTNLLDALDCYEHVLGFQVGWRWGEPARLASVCRDRVELNLSQSPKAKPEASMVYLKMAGVDAYYKHIIVAGAKVEVPLGDRPYGMRDFKIVDPSGNELSFGEATTSRSVSTAAACGNGVAGPGDAADRFTAALRPLFRGR